MKGEKTTANIITVYANSGYLIETDQKQQEHLIDNLFFRNCTSFN